MLREGFLTLQASITLSVKVADRTFVEGDDQALRTLLVDRLEDSVVEDNSVSVVGVFVHILDLAPQGLTALLRRLPLGSAISRSCC